MKPEKAEPKTEAKKKVKSGSQGGQRHIWMFRTKIVGVETTPKSSIFNRVFGKCKKPSIFGVQYPYFWKHPYQADVFFFYVERKGPGKFQEFPSERFFCSCYDIER